MDRATLFALAALFGAFGTCFARGIALRRKILNQPNPIVPQHTCAVPYLGGLGIAIGIGLTALFADLNLPMRVAFPALLFLVIGTLDDLRPIPPGPKFGIQALAAAAAVAAGNRAALTGWGTADILLSALWIIITVNAFNVTDVCDGLVGGLSVICFLFLALLIPNNSTLLFAMAAASLGFLLFNFPPARIFLGDGGSHLLGFLAASFTLTLVRNSGRWPELPQALLICSLPLSELAFLVATRICKGIPWWKGSADHFSLRLQVSGLSRSQTDLVAWTLSALFGLQAVLLNGSPRYIQMLMLAAASGVLVCFGLVLFRFNVPVQRNGERG
jgi:UDP-GlcNAc:undecaprenyl-phosphate GlcNAc-1-phosphate transferase